MRSDSNTTEFERKIMVEIARRRMACPLLVVTRIFVILLGLFGVAGTAQAAFECEPAKARQVFRAVYQLHIQTIAYCSEGPRYVVVVAEPGI
jgi:hypothetical protein